MDLSDRTICYSPLMAFGYIEMRSRLVLILSSLDGKCIALINCEVINMSCDKIWKLNMR